MDLRERIAHGYFFAKRYVISKGYANEIDWQDKLNFTNIAEEVVLKEFCWVVLSSGMSEKVIKKIFPMIKSIMFDFISADLIVKKKKRCIVNALKVINHRGKIEAIIYFAEYLSINSLEIFKSELSEKGINFLQAFPYLGKATSYHFAKNIGFDVAKPDRHLIRISNILGYSTPNDLCTDISIKIEEKKSLIDLVLWRYATIDKKYLDTISWFFKENLALGVNMNKNILV